MTFNKKFTTNYVWPFVHCCGAFAAAAAALFVAAPLLIAAAADPVQVNSL